MADVLTEIAADGVASVILNRPEVHNAFNDRVIADLTDIFARLGADPAVRAVLLRGNGPSFSAGGDLNWMKRMAGYTREENRADALGLAGMLRTLNELPKPTLAVVHGNAFAGAVGLVSCCDVAVAAEGVQFALTEVKLGLIPATISPYVIAAMGARACRRYFLTAERFDAAEAKALGLVHAVVPAEALDATVATLLKRLLEGGPRALAESKRLIRDVVGRPIDDALIADTADRIAEARASDEGREGVSSFLEKRKPAWTAPRG